MARADYAANIGSNSMDEYWPGPPDYQTGIIDLAMARYFFPDRGHLRAQLDPPVGHHQWD